MYSDDDLEAAVGEGILTTEAVASFRRFINQRQSSDEVDEENFRLLTGFNDIFVSIAILLILTAIGQLGSGLQSPVAGGVIAVASWGLAEYFTRQKRMALPSLILLASFAAGVFTACVIQLGAAQFLPSQSNGLLFAASGAITAAAVYAHWRRFHVPITVAAGCCAGLITLLGLAEALLPLDRTNWLLPVMFAGGLMVFTVAFLWDASDRQRQTRRSDVAFWLHLLASPLIVHPVFSSLGLLHGGDGTASNALLAIAIYAALGLVALAVDRRAMLVSALAYVLYAMSSLLQAGGLSENFALTALVIGSVLLLLSALWHRTRRLVLACLPAAVLRWLPVA